MWGPSKADVIAVFAVFGTVCGVAGVATWELVGWLCRHIQWVP